VDEREGAKQLELGRQTMSTFWSCGLQLRVVEGPNKGRTYPMDAPEMTLGRARSAGDRAPGWILLFDEAVSRIHADLTWNPKMERFVLTSRSETNKTFVNGKEVHEAFLDAGDQIVVGKTQLDLQEADFRFGGSRPPSARHLTPSSAVNPALIKQSSTNDGETRQNTKKAKRVVALTTRPKLQVRVLSGPANGELHPISGMLLGLGGTAEVDPEAVSRFKPDQFIALAEPNLRPDALLLEWRELEDAFELALIDPNLPPLEIERKADGIQWSGQILPQQSPLIRIHDIVWIGPLAFTIEVDDEE
jgi:pSer/pThr/pTyr-binding forkhead associated (FHA) protein